jgi:pimeloyl-ACP methyl ester carboxylesterase
VARLPPAHDASVVTRGPWWTHLEPSLRVPRRSGDPAAIWTAGEGPSLLLVPPAGGSHDVWAPISVSLRASCTVHALDRGATALFADDVDLVATAAGAVGACFVAGYADDAAVLREAVRRTPVVRRALVLSSSSGPRAAEQLDERFMVCVEVSAAGPEALTGDDAARMIDSLRLDGEA